MSNGEATVATGWSYSVPPPSGFGRDKQVKFQQQIDEVVGTTDGRSRIKLDWGPEALTWHPHKLGDDPLGYTFPIFYAGKDANGNYLAAERWVLRQRLEWGQYGPTWEAIRYKKHQGFIWDLKGPCPSEKYVELHCHSYHNGKCCVCVGDECKCEIHCWGEYVEPNEKLMEAVREFAWNSQRDPDVDPFADVRFFEAPNAQREVKNTREQAYNQDRLETEAFDREAVDLFLKAPHTISRMVETAKIKVPQGFKKQKGSRLYLPN